MQYIKKYSGVLWQIAQLYFWLIALAGLYIATGCKWTYKILQQLGRYLVNVYSGNFQDYAIDREPEPQYNSAASSYKG